MIPDRQQPIQENPIQRCGNLREQALFLENVLKEASDSTDWKLLARAQSDLLKEVDDELERIDDLERQRRRDARLSSLYFQDFTESELQRHEDNGIWSSGSLTIQREIDEFFNHFLETDFGRAYLPLLNADTFADYLSDGFSTLRSALRKRRKSLQTILGDGYSPVYNVNHCLPTQSEAILRKPIRGLSRYNQSDSLKARLKPHKDEYITYFPPFGPPDYEKGLQHAPEYSSPNHSIPRSRYGMRRLWQPSESFIPPENSIDSATSENSLRAYLRSAFSIKARNTYSQQGVDIIGDRKYSTMLSRNTTPYGYTSPQIDAESYPALGESDLEFVKSRRRNLDLLSRGDYDPSPNSNVILNEEKQKTHHSALRTYRAHESLTGTKYLKLSEMDSLRPKKVCPSKDIEADSDDAYSFLSLDDSISITCGPNDLATGADSIKERQQLSNDDTSSLFSWAKPLSIDFESETPEICPSCDAIAQQATELQCQTSKQISELQRDGLENMRRGFKKFAESLFVHSEARNIIVSPGMAISDLLEKFSTHLLECETLKSTLISEVHKKKEHNYTSACGPTNVKTNVSAPKETNSYDECRWCTDVVGVGELSGDGFENFGGTKKRIGNGLWIFRFINSKGNEYFCDIDEEYLTDRFNLTGLNTEVQYYQYALDLITDVFDLDCDDEVRDQIEKSARHLYGLVHARYIATNRGLIKMMEKYKSGDFGKCPRVACQGQYLLPTGQHDIANVSAVKLYCARCEDLYNPKSPRHSAIDGAYFGTSFPHILFQVYPQALPEKTQKRYEPRIYGFRVHAAAALARWQSEEKDLMKERLADELMDTGFEDEDLEDEMEFDNEAGAGQDGLDDIFERRRDGGTATKIGA